MIIQDLIDNRLKQDQEDRRDRPRSGKFSPSLFGRCYRAQIYNRKDIPSSNDIDARTLRVFKAGHLFHKFVGDLVIGEKEVKIEEEDVLGYADIVTDDSVVELKSQHSRAFWYMSQGKEESDEVYLERIKKSKMPNILQSTYYAQRLCKPNIHLVYISKDDLCIRQFDWDINEFIGKVEVELLELRRWWNDVGLPPPTPRAYIGKDGKSKECGHCNWKDLCKNA